MELSYKEEVFSIINEFQLERASVDWSCVWENDDAFEEALDALDSLINNIALLAGVDEQAKIAILGKLAIKRSELGITYSNSDKAKEFIKAGDDVTNLLHDVIAFGSWMKTAQERFDEYEKAEDEMTDESPIEFAQLEYFRPVFIAMSIMTLITIDQEISCEDEFCDEE